MRTSPGGKFRVAWSFLYFSNHSPANLMLAAQIHEPQTERKNSR
jgi:hypothetical protein